VRYRVTCDFGLGEARRGGRAGVAWGARWSLSSIHSPARRRALLRIYQVPRVPAIYIISRFFGYVWIVWPVRGGARWSSLWIPWFAGRRRVVGSEGIIFIDLFVRRAADELLCACTTSPPAGVSLIFGCMCIVLAGERRAGSWIRERWG
jgi:hypothetical protein